MVKLTLIATLATAVFASAAQAAPAGRQRDDVLAQLSERYREAPIGIGVAGNGGLIELLTASTGTTWTLIITLPNGPTCLLAAGQGLAAAADGRARRARHLEARPAAPNRRAADTNRSRHVQAGAFSNVQAGLAGMEGALYAHSHRADLARSARR